MYIHYMKNSIHNKFQGYIEGYYGKILSWCQRKRILDALNQNNMNFYFYCPKEDIYHRHNWRSNYPQHWYHNFKKFITYSNKKKIKIITGISPGLSIALKKNSKNYQNDFDCLLNKFEKFLENGSHYIALLFDDLPLSQINYKNLGLLHSQLANNINKKFSKKLFVTPLIYADELIKQSPNYLNQFLSNLSDEIKIFYCGKNIVSKNFHTKNLEINKRIKKNSIIFWDNFYANDYCPKRLIVGPWKNKNLQEQCLINGTGLIETDLLILDIVRSSINSDHPENTWKKVIKQRKIPDDFLSFKNYFLSPNFSSDKNLKKIKNAKKIYHKLDNLLWNWKCDLSIEWFPYLLNLKHDIQLYHGNLSYDRILKTQTLPMQHVLLKKGE